MKKKLFVFLFCVFLLLLIFFELPIRQQIYYANKKNYIETTGCVDYFGVYENGTYLEISLKNISYIFPDSRFYIRDENLEIVKKNGIFMKMHKGDQIVFKTAPYYFGDGYKIPIVSISIKGETLLPFEEGYKNLNKMLWHWIR